MIFFCVISTREFTAVSLAHLAHAYFAQVFIPADGMAEFQHNLGELIDEYDNGKERDDNDDNLSLIIWSR